MNKPKTKLSLAERRKIREALKIYYSTLAIEPFCKKVAAWTGHESHDTLRPYIEAYIEFMKAKIRNDDGGNL
jgi:hypothetical protein